MMIKAFSAIKSFIAPPFVWFRRRLESARTKNPRIFDFLTEFVKFAITMLGCFSPALITSAVGLGNWKSSSFLRSINASVGYIDQ